MDSVLKVVTIELDCVSFDGKVDGLLDDKVDGLLDDKVDGVLDDNWW